MSEGLRDGLKTMPIISSENHYRENDLQTGRIPGPSGGDKEDAAEQLEKLRAELDKPDPDKNRVRRFWERAWDVVKDVAETAGPLVALGQLIGAIYSGTATR